MGGEAGNVGSGGASGSGGAIGGGGAAGEGGATGGTAGGAAGSGGASGSAGASGAGGAAGNGGAKDAGPMVDVRIVDAPCIDSGDAPDKLSVPNCGQTGAPTRKAYNGTVTITVSGIIQNAPGVSNDPFYDLDANDTSKSTAASPVRLVYNRFSEGNCLCSYECSTTSHQVASLLVGAYPAFNPLHTYTVVLDLGSGAPERIQFAYGDCGCNDNAGSWSLTMSQGACGN
jgi:hypothetical protein